jgi:gliding motility-associated-like protein
MKKVLLLSLTFCIFSVASVAQNKIVDSYKQKAIKEKEQSLKETKKGKVKAGSTEYAKLKADGELHKYEISYSLNENKQLKITDVKDIYAGKTTTTVLTPCTFPDVTGVLGYTAEVDDSPLLTIALPFNFCFYGVTYTAVNISANGNLQFGTNSTAFTPGGFPNNTVNMIAPFWADGESHVVSGGVIYGKLLIDPHPDYFVITWDSMGYFNNHVDKLNTFQCVISDGLSPVLPPGKNVGFYYTKMQWTTGDASTGTSGFPTTQPGNPATVGINRGNGIDYFAIGRFGVPGSIYDGPVGNNDGVSWLDGQSFFFNSCSATNIEPISMPIGSCSSYTVCGNDTLYLKNTFLAPEVTQSTTITVSAPSLGASFTYSVISTGSTSDIYMVIDGSTAPAGSHTVTMSATDNGTPVQTSVQSFSVFINQSAVNNLDGAITITPNIGACPGGTVTANVTVTGGVPDTYLWNNNSITPSTSFTINAAADSLIFVTLTSGQCKKTIVGDINVNPIPVANISGTLDYCSTSMGTVLTATNVLNPSTQGPHTYTWTGSGTIGSANSASTTLSAGVYTVVVANQFGCLSTAATTVVVNEGPDYVLSTNATSGGTLYCSTLDTARIALNYAAASTAVCGLATTNCISSNSYSIGAGATANTNTGNPCPFGNYDKNRREQYLYTATELTAAGLVAGKISSIAFMVNSKQPLNTTGTSSSTTYIGTLPNYSVKLKCTNAAALTTTLVNAGLNEVFLGDYTPVVGINTINFNQDYIWDGISNLLIDVCYTRTVSLASTYYTSNPIIPNTNVGAGKCAYFSSDVTPACGNPTGTLTNNRPNIIFGSCLAQQLPSQFDIAVTPTLGVVIPTTKDSIKIDLPPGGTSQCYTVTVTNPLGGCSKDTVICIFSDQGLTTATFTASTPSVCVGSPVTLFANGATTYTIYYIQGGVPVALTSNTTVTHVPVQQGLNVYSLTAVGNCGAAPVGYTVGVMVVPTANLIMSPLQDMTKCMNRDYVITTGVNSTNTNPGTPYTYNWTTLPGNLPAPGNNTSSSYTCSSNSTTTLVVTVNGVCANGTTGTVVIKNFADDLSISIIDSSTTCANTAFNLTSFVSGGYPDYNYTWYIEPNPNAISHDANLVYVSPSIEGNYKIGVYVNDSCGYNRSAYETIVVLPPCSVEIPNIITPNGDGVNEFFVIKNIEYHPNTIVTIFDRWGRKIYENQNYNNEWKAENASDGTYFYVVDVPDDKKHNGFITVFKGK